MAILHVRGVPDELHEVLRRRAAAHNRSLSAEVIALLARATGTDDIAERWRESLEKLDAFRARVKPDPTDSIELMMREIRGVIVEPR